ncbi:MAG TPA: response regulator, partial [Proteobacteria bacterium]|nr:response regulator [Pseudomonadota bacterium]
VRQNDGFINVYSEVGKGTTFRIYFPRFESAPEAIGETVEPELITGNETILVVEDEELILEFIKEALGTYGYHILGAGSPEDAIELCEKQETGIDLLLTDVVMPSMNGKELADRVKAFFPGIGTIFMSGYTVDVVAHRSILEKGVNFVQKPFNLETLGRTIREVLDSPA